MLPYVSPQMLHWNLTTPLNVPPSTEKGTAKNATRRFIPNTFSTLPLSLRCFSAAYWITL
jgi:hypothetical protein